ncbi:DNA damage-regulated autophagy modulator protein 1-like [Aquarana catesbeiana]|uniref:DNA damage-regulated autophagy modulator protein 1-like n=1 Tax=Aquarana catesbeiana TaxID=8400 RepID=UPI003CC98B05
MNRLVILPIIWAILVTVGLITTFVLTVEYHHFDTYVLYISNTGCFEPEKSIFFGVLALAAVLDAIIKYYMYEYLSIRSENRHPWARKAILAIGWISCVGTILVGANPVNSSPLPHRIGTVLSFGGAIIHNICLATLQYKLNIISRPMFYTRMVNAIITIIFATIFCLLLNRELWAPEWQEIVFDIDVLSEWIAASTLLINNISYCVDLNSLQLTSQHSVGLYWNIEYTDTGCIRVSHSWQREEEMPTMDQSSEHANAHSWQREEILPNLLYVQTAGFGTDWRPS